MRRISLRTWILLPAWTLITGLIVVLSLSQADTLVSAWLRSSQDIAELAGQQVKQTLLRRLEESTPQSAHDATSRWSAFIRTDPGLESAIEGVAGRGGAIVEISIEDQSGRVLVSSDRARAGKFARQTEPLSALENLGFRERFRRLFAQAKDYDYSIPIGVAGESKPLFTIRVLVSNVLLRDSLIPGMRRIAVVAAAALVLSLALVYAVAAYTTSNLKRIGAMIDRIGAGGPALQAESNNAQPVAAEFQAVGSKLNLLDTKFRDAMQDAAQYRNRVSAMLESLEEAILLLDNDQIVLTAGPVASLLGQDTPPLLPPPIKAAIAARRRVRDRTVRWKDSGRERQSVLNLDFIGTTALLRLRDAEGAGEVESQLELSSRLEAINRLTGGVAHEIKNPLNAISARLAILESMVSEDVSDAEHQIRTIANEIERLDRVVRTFLDFTRPLEIVRDELNLAAIAQEVAKMLEPDAVRRGVAITLDGVDLALPIRGDRDLLKQAIWNIAVNGLEVMTQGGELRMHVGEGAGAARLCIGDTGPGIPKAQLGEIFQLYFTTKKNGSGIGLAVAYRTLQLHGGDLTVESEVGKGSTFCLSLPIVGMEEAVEKGVPHHFAGAGLSV